MQKDLEAIYDWAEKNKMKFKGTACKIFRWPNKDFKIGFKRSAAYGACPMSPSSCNVFGTPPLYLRPIGRKCENLLRAFISKHAKKNYYFFSFRTLSITNRRFFS